jgi:hypothetical protein
MLGMPWSFPTTTGLGAVTRIRRPHSTTGRTDYRFELVAAGASGDLAYTVGYEHISFSMDGVPVEPWTLRVTHVYRREDGEWKIVHRHADAPRSTRPHPLTHRRSRHRGQRDQLQVHHLRVNPTSKTR